MSQLAAVVLAAGRSRRMKSTLSKVLHPAAGRPLLYYPIVTALELGASDVVVVVNPDNRQQVDETLRALFPGLHLRLATQDPPRGTGDAVGCAIPALVEVGCSHLLILSGDAPLVTPDSLRPLVVELAPASLALGTCRLDNPAGYGRVLRDADGKPARIVEQKDLRGEAEAAIEEVNAGLYCASFPELREALARLTPQNAQGEYYLTDIVPHFAAAGSVRSVAVAPDAMAGVNDRAQLCAVESILYERIAERHRLAGATVAPDARVDESVALEQDVTVCSGVHLRGKTSIGRGAFVDVGCVLTDTVVAEAATLLPYTVATRSQVGEGSRLGPFSHLRAGSQLERDVHLGNFVETKNTVMRRGAKANHLSYLGDGEVGQRSNVGAGTIFCNYDGFSKHHTSIGDDVFVGSDSQFVAPVAVGAGAFVATATCVTHDVPPDALAIGRHRQENKVGYATKLRATLQAAKEAKQRRGSK